MQSTSTSDRTSSRTIIAGSGRLPTLTGMRFLAAFLVFVYHGAWERFFVDPDISTGYLNAIELMGPVGVSFFFILSGFVLTWTARPDDTKKLFWRRRLTKIYPNHFLGCVAGIILLLVTDQAVRGDGAILNVLLLNTWYPGRDAITGVNDVSWSLACEAFFYLSFPLLYWVISRIRPERLWLWAGGVTAVIIMVPVFADTLSDQPVIPLWQLWMVFFFPPVRCLEFVLGMLIARLVISGRWKVPIGIAPAAALGVVAYLIGLQLPIVYIFVSATVIPLALLIGAGAVADIEGKASPLRNRTAVWLGEISFAFYIVHHLILAYGHRAFGVGKAWETPAALLVLVSALAVTIVVAALMYSFVERPMMRRFARPRRRRPTARDGSGGAQPPVPSPRTAQDGADLSVT